MHDFHTHSNYSDGDFLERMLDVAETAGLEGIGIADHCYVTDRDPFRDARARVGMNLDRTYDRRRRAIDALREETDVRIYDAVEMDYDPRDVSEIRRFLEEADFEYAIGSVHRIDDVNIQVESAVSNRSDAELDAMVDEYFETLVELIESELFEIAAHLDLPERTPSLRGRATEDHYRRVAEAFARSRTVPEVNAGRALSDAELVHPSPSFLQILRERGVPFTVGTDAHYPNELVDRTQFVAEFLEENDLEPVHPLEV